MSGPLSRLLRLRSLLENSSRMELERRAALAARIKSAQQCERDVIRASRAQVVTIIDEDGSPVEQAQQRTTEWTSAESAAWREQQLQPMAEATARRVSEMREEYLERRKERRQVESILDAERARIQIEKERRTQRNLDDWFGAKHNRLRRND